MDKLLAPLAEITEDSGDFNDYICANDNLDDNCNVTDYNLTPSSQRINSGHATENEVDFDDDIFNDSFSGSLEDLVNTFDERITKCFRNYNEQTDQLAPIQVRSQDEIISDSTLWSTLINNCGNIRPIDWNKTRARELQLRGLDLNHFSSAKFIGNCYDSSSEFTDDDEKSRDVKDTSIISSYYDEPVLTAEQVLEEIDQIMHGSTSGPDSCLGSCSSTAYSSPSDESASLRVLEVEREKLPMFTGRKLSSFNICQLSELSLDLEKLIQSYSETLIQQLALRDELDYEKELKSTFISLVIGVQDKRYQIHAAEKKKVKQQQHHNNSFGNIDHTGKYLTTVIPYHSETGSPNVQSLQILIKILRAIDEDSPTVPTLLTDYILKVICPT